MDNQTIQAGTPKRRGRPPKNGQPKTPPKSRAKRYEAKASGIAHRVLDGIGDVGNKVFHNSSRFFGTDKTDLVGSYYRQIIDLVFVLGMGAGAFVSYYFAPPGYRILVAPLIFIGLFAVEWGMHGAGRVIVAAACTDAQKKWMYAVVIVGGLFIFTDTILFIQSFTHENSDITKWLQKYTSFLAGGEAIIILFLYSTAMSLDDRRNAVMYHNGATAQGFKFSVEDALEQMRLLGEYNQGVRTAHKNEKKLALDALTKALKSKAAKATRKEEAEKRSKEMAADSMELMSRNIDELSADLLAALDALNKTDLQLPDFQDKNLNLN